MFNRKFKQLLRSHETTRLLISDLEQRHIQLLHRVSELEEIVRKNA
jgi:hypothetical protein